MMKKTLVKKVQIVQITTLVRLVSTITHLRTPKMREMRRVMKLQLHYQKMRNPGTRMILKRIQKKRARAREFLRVRILLVLRILGSIVEILILMSIAKLMRVVKNLLMKMRVLVLQTRLMIPNLLVREMRKKSLVKRTLVKIVVRANNLKRAIAREMKTSLDLIRIIPSK